MRKMLSITISVSILLYIALLLFKCDYYTVHNKRASKLQDQIQVSESISDARKYIHNKEYSKALKVLSKAEDILIKEGGFTDIFYRSVILIKSNCYMEQGDKQNALKLCQELINAYEKFNIEHDVIYDTVVENVNKIEGNLGNSGTPRNKP